MQLFCLTIQWEELCGCVALWEFESLGMCSWGVIQQPVTASNGREFCTPSPCHFDFTFLSAVVLEWCLQLHPFMALVL